MMGLLLDVVIYGVVGGVFVMIFTALVKPIQYKRNKEWPLWQQKEIYNDDMDFVGFEPPVCFRLNRMIGAGFEVGWLEGQSAKDYIYLKHPNGKSFCLDDSGLLFGQDTRDNQIRIKPDNAKGFEEFCQSFEIPKYRKALGERCVRWWLLLIFAICVYVLNLIKL
jgi:hypothetical protein